MEQSQPSLKPVKISCGYSAKASQNYQSENYSINLEMEVMVNGKTSELEQKADLLYDLCRKIVAKQRGTTATDALLAPSERTSAPSQPAVTSQVPSNTSDVISPKQIKFIHSLSRSRGFDSKKTKEIIYDQYHKAVEQLSRKEAAAVIDDLKSLKQAA